MKTFLTKLVGMVSILVLFLVFTEPVNASVGITFTFANAQVTTGGNAFLNLILWHMLMQRTHISN